MFKRDIKSKILEEKKINQKKVKRRGNKNRWGKQKRTNNMVESILNMSVITLNIRVQTPQIKDKDSQIGVF